MKKQITAVLLAVAMALPSAAFAAQEQIVVELDGKVLNVSPAPITENGRTLAPFRSIFEALGCAVGWEEETETVTGTKEGTTISFVIGSSKATVNGETKELQVPAKTVDGRTMVPVRFIAEALNCTVDWDEANQRVIIKTGTYAPTNNTESTIYAVDGTGEYAGYRQLKGYPEENEFAVYFKATDHSREISVVEIGYNPNEIVVWTDNGKTYKNTKANVYQFFWDIQSLQSMKNDQSGEYSPEWMKEKFGKVYDKWHSGEVFEYTAQQMVRKFLDNDNRI